MLILSWMRAMAQCNKAVIVGSVATRDDDGQLRNRLYFVRPDGTYEYYDKRHLFTFAGETKDYVPGNRRVVVEWGGVRILLQVCYDLRYPIWARNRDDYDCILYSSNWPISRDTAWKTLIRARAIENQCYVAAANRIGTDQQCEYYGRAAIINPYGETMALCPDKTEWAASGIIDIDFLHHYNGKFPRLEDADNFTINIP